MKIFRRFREKLLGGGKTSKYLLYALGEIILVVIGILIALGINVKNEELKSRKTRVDLASRIIEQIDKDVANTTKTIDKNSSKKGLFDKILRETKPNEPIKNCDNCISMVLGNVMIANTDPKAKILLEKAQLSSDSLSDALRRTQSIYEQELEVIAKMEDIILNKFEKNLDYLESNFDWFADFAGNNHCNDDCKKFFEYNPRFRNITASQELLINGPYTQELIRFREELLAQKEVLQKIIEDEDL